MKFSKQGGFKAGIVAITLGLLAVFFGAIKSEPGISAEPEPAPTSTPSNRLPSTQRQAPSQPTPAPTTQQPHTRTRGS